MKRIGVQLMVLFVLLVSIWSCDKARVFEEYKEIPSSIWHKDSLLVFNIPIADTLANHNFYINVRNDVNYKYSNLWLFITIDQPNGTILTDTFEISLADPTGKWLGEGFGGLKTRQMMYKRNVFFPISGDYRINIQHAMRGDLLEGISDIGLRVEKQ